jgi:type II secretory pathway pseudopilin PulG
MLVTQSSKSRHSSNAGFTLIELLLTVVILMVAVVSVAHLVPLSVASNLRNRNDSTALITAQRLVEQMSQQSLTASGGICAGISPPANSYDFCDSDGDGIALGRTGVANNTTTSDGCPLNASGNIDFTQAASSCSGYTVTKTTVWNPVTNTNQIVELRWRVVTLHDSIGNPYRKVFIVAGRAGGQSMSLMVANLQTVVGP